MAGDQPTTPNNEYGNKLLNGEGLLHLVGTIKTEISNAGGGGGGATYTAGNGIDIDENNTIEMKANIRNMIIEQMMRKAGFSSTTLYTSVSTREGFIEALRAGK